MFVNNNKYKNRFIDRVVYRQKSSANIRIFNEIHKYKTLNYRFLRPENIFLLTENSVLRHKNKHFLLQNKG